MSQQNDFHEPAAHLSEPPTVQEERAQRKAHVQAIAAIFKRRPLEEIEASDFEHITPNCHQRISNCRTDLGMHIVYSKRWILRSDGSKQRIGGTWRYQPFESLGPSSAEYRTQPRLI